MVIQSMKLFLWITGIILLTQSCSQTPPKAPTTIGVHESGHVVAEGQAKIIKGAQLLARQRALQQAIRQAALIQASEVNGQTKTENGKASFDAESITIKAKTTVATKRIIEEREQDGFYYVKADISFSDNGICRSPYRRRIIATGFPILHPEHVSDVESNDLDVGIPREIGNILTETGRFFGKDLSQHTIYSDPENAPEIIVQQPFQFSSLMRLAKENSSQLVLSGVIRDLKINPTEYTRGQGVFAYAKSMLRDIWAERNISIDIYVHDGYTGVLLFKHRYTDQVGGDVWIPSSYTVGSYNFMSTNTGEKITAIIKKATIDINRALSCYMFTARIIKVENKKVYLDAGAQEGLKPGDQMIAYANTSGDLTTEGQEFMGRDKNAVAVVKIKDVKPRFAVGELEIAPELVGIREGDWVQAW